MSDFITPENLTAAGGAVKQIVLALGGSQAALRVFGPSLDRLGHRLDYMWPASSEAIMRVIHNALSKLRDDDLERSGTLSPRVLNQLIDEAAFADDQMIAEYLGGVLASAAPIDDSIPPDIAVTWTQLIKSMSSAELAAHFVIYRALFDRLAQLPDLEINTANSRDLTTLDVWISLGEVNLAGGLHKTLRHALIQLHAHGLIGTFHTGDDREPLDGRPEQPRLQVRPTTRGIDLAQWAMGLGHREDASIDDMAMALRDATDRPPTPSAVIRAELDDNSRP